MIQKYLEKSRKECLPEKQDQRLPKPWLKVIPSQGAEGCQDNRTGIGWGYAERRLSFHQGLKQAEKPKAKTKDDAEGSEKLDSTIKFQTTERNMPRSANIKISVAARPRKPHRSLCRWLYNTLSAIWKAQSMYQLQARLQAKAQLERRTHASLLKIWKEYTGKIHLHSSSLKAMSSKKGECFFAILKK